MSKQRFSGNPQLNLENLTNVLVESVRKRCVGIKDSVMVLFSGGLDSAVLAAILAQILPEEIDIDLVNVSFDPENSPDRISSLIVLEDILKISPNRKIRLLCSDHKIDSETLGSSQFTLIADLIEPKSSHMDFNIAAALHLAAA